MHNKKIQINHYTKVLKNYLMFKKNSCYTIKLNLTKENGKNNKKEDAQTDISISVFQK